MDLIWKKKDLYNFGSQKSTKVDDLPGLIESIMWKASFKINRLLFGCWLSLKSKSAIFCKFSDSEWCLFSAQNSKDCKYWREKIALKNFMHPKHHVDSATKMKLFHVSKHQCVKIDLDHTQTYTCLSSSKATKFTWNVNAWYQSFFDSYRIPYIF